MREQKYGRIINTSSASGVYGVFGQTNYCAAKMGIHGLSLALAREGLKRNILINLIFPVAVSRLTETVMSMELLANLKIEYVVPLVAVLSHKDSKETGAIYELGAGYISKLRWQRNQGYFFNTPFKPEDVKDKWDQVAGFGDTMFYHQTSSEIFEIFFNKEDFIKQQKEGKTTPAQSQKTLNLYDLIQKLKIFLNQQKPFQTEAKEKIQFQKSKKSLILRQFLKKVVQQQNRG